MGRMVLRFWPSRLLAFLCLLTCAFALGFRLRQLLMHYGLFDEFVSNVHVLNLSRNANFRGVNELYWSYTGWMPDAALHVM